VLSLHAKKLPTRLQIISPLARIMKWANSGAAENRS
jgi:hypothetical protein